ncbi:MAG: cyclic nucleotide-binding protein, partial [Stellaceae bacterium]
MRNVLYILGQLTDADAEWLALHGKKLRLSDGEAIVNEGGAIDALHITLDGRFRVTLRDGREVAQLSA